MLTPASSYEDLYRGFRWQIPDSYNIGYDVCDRHAGDVTKRALIYEDAAGQIQEYTFLEIMRRSPTPWRPKGWAGATGSASFCRSVPRPP